MFRALILGTLYSGLAAVCLTAGQYKRLDRFVMIHGCKVPRRRFTKVLPDGTKRGPANQEICKLLQFMGSQSELAFVVLI